MSLSDKIITSIFYWKQLELGEGFKLENLNFFNSQLSLNCFNLFEWMQMFHYDYIVILF